MNRFTAFLRAPLLMLALGLAGGTAVGAGAMLVNAAGAGTEAAFLADEDRRLVARLRAFEGGQNYRLPNGFAPDDLHAVTIWCEQFGE